MGTDKALLEVDGVPMAVRVAGALTDAGATTVAAVGGRRDALGAAGLEALPDRWPGEGPLGGVVASLGSVGREPTVVVLSCDLLDPDARLVADLARRREDLGVDLVVPTVGGRPQWTHGAWRRSVVDALEAAFAAGERSLHGAVADLRVEHHEVADPATIADADVPTDLRSRRGHT